MGTEHAVKDIDAAALLLTAAERASDPMEKLLLLRIATAWLELARYRLKPAGPSPPNPIKIV